MILDARGPNPLEPGLQRWVRSLGSIDYYYYFEISKERRVQNALGILLRESEACGLKCFTRDLAGRGPFRPSLASMAMGDLNSVEFGQAAHVALMLQAGVAITLRSRPCRGPIQVGVVIDDLIILEKMGQEEFRQLLPGASAGAKRKILGGPSTAEFQEKL